jgi:GTP pyrophosphokinase
MHRIAEFGIAAHWAYKEQSFARGKKANVTVNEDKLSWLRESLEWQKDMQDPQEFLATLKTELFEDEVYVFTPKGEIKTLPKGSTPIDFAYLIHDQIGNKMVGAKINSRMMPIITPLKNGDIVEVITNDNSRGPSRDWLKFIKSTQAKTKILKFFKKRDRQQNIDKGKEIVEKEIKKIGLQEDELFADQYVKPALQRFVFKTLEDMYAAVGFGSIGANKFISRVLEEYRKENKDKINIEEKMEELHEAQTKRVRSKSKTGIIVKGIDNCLVKLSRCCNPVQGDEIIGYITRGRGVTVHRKDCTNVKELFTEGERIVEVYWDEQKENTSYSVDVNVFANDRDDLLSDVVVLITKSDANMLSIKANVNHEKIVTINLKLEVKNTQMLDKIIRDLEKIDSVYDVKRGH